MEKSYYIHFFSDLPIQPPKINQLIEDILVMSRTQENIAPRLNKLTTASRILIKFLKTKVNIPETLYKTTMNN